MSRRERVGGGSTFRSSQPSQPSTRRLTPAASCITPSASCTPSNSPKPSSRPRPTPVAAQSASQPRSSPALSRRDPQAPLRPLSERLGRASHRTEASQGVLGSSRTRGGSGSSQRSTHRTSASHLEAKVNAEVKKIFEQVDKDVGFNMEDVYESYEARKIVEDQEADARGALEYQHRIRDVDEDGDGKIDDNEMFVNKTSKLALDEEQETDPVMTGEWKSNQNKSMKWWQGDEIGQITDEEATLRGLSGLHDHHPAYFIMRRRDPTMNYVKEPTYKTRSELLAMRKKRMLPPDSYDLDGDGNVGIREYFMAARMDKDVSGELSLEEKQRGLKNMRKDMAAVMFVDNAGKQGDRMGGNQYRILQEDGKIVLDQQ